MTETIDTSRRDLLAVAPLLAALPQLLLGAGSAEAAPDPTKTIVVPPKDIVFKPSLGAPPQSIEVAELFSKSSLPASIST